MSEADEIEDITNAAGTGAVDFPKGLNIAGSASGIVGITQTVSTTEPSFPSNGDTWYDPVNYVYYVRINNEWKAFLGSPPAVGSQGDRGVFIGGSQATTPIGAANQTMDYISISTTGNAVDFGDMVQEANNHKGGASNKIRGVIMGGSYGSTTTKINNIQYLTFASSGGTQDFGDLSANTYHICSTSDSTYGLGWGGYTSSPLNTIRYITIATTSNSSDFGDATIAARKSTGLDEATRNIKAGGELSNGDPINNIDYVTVATPGNATDFGDLTAASEHGSSGSDLTRGVINRGTELDYITMATTGNATDFGDSLYSGVASSGASYNGRLCMAGGGNYTSGINIHYVTIQTLGNSLDFGDLTLTRLSLGSCSGNAA